MRTPERHPMRREYQLRLGLPSKNSESANVISFCSRLHPSIMTWVKATGVPIRFLQKKSVFTQNEEEIRKIFPGRMERVSDVRKERIIPGRQDVRISAFQHWSAIHWSPSDRAVSRYNRSNPPQRPSYHPPDSQFPARSFPPAL